MATKTDKKSDNATVRMTSPVPTGLHEQVKAKAKGEGISQGDLVSQALEAFLNSSQPSQTSQDNPCSFLGSEGEVEYFSTVTDKEGKRTQLLEGLEGYGVEADSEGIIRLTPSQLLNLASQVTGKTEEDILQDGLSYIAQKLITQELSSGGKQGTLGAADNRIIEAINDLRHMITEGEYRPRKKAGKSLLGESTVAGKAMTSVTTVRNFMKRKPEVAKLLDVSDLLD